MMESLTELGWGSYVYSDNRDLYLDKFNFISCKVVKYNITYRIDIKLYEIRRFVLERFCEVFPYIMSLYNFYYNLPSCDVIVLYICPAAATTDEMFYGTKL